jgi:hypothetical protein
MMRRMLSLRRHQRGGECIDRIDRGGAPGAEKQAQRRVALVHVLPAQRSVEKAQKIDAEYDTCLTVREALLSEHRSSPGQGVCR